MGIRGEVLLDRPPVFTFMLKGMSTEMILEPSVTYWTSDDLARLGFSRSVVTARKLNLALRKRRCSGELVSLNGVAGASVRG